MQIIKNSSRDYTIPKTDLRIRYRFQYSKKNSFNLIRVFFHSICPSRENKKICLSYRACDHPSRHDFRFFSHGIFFLNILWIRRGVKYSAGSLAASAAAARGSVSVSLFAFCLPAEHRGVQESRGAIERRRLVVVERRAENRAPCYDSPLRAPASRPFYSASGRRYEKG